MRAVLRCPAILLCGALLACGGKGGGADDPPPIPPGPIPTFQCADQAPAADHVVLRCAEQVAPGEWRIEVVVGVPTASSDISGFDFYVEFDPQFLAYVPGSAVEGNFLDRDGETVFFAAGIDPTDPGRLIVGISRTGAAGLAGLPGYERVMSFNLMALTTAPFGPLVPVFRSFRAFDSSVQAIPEIVFDDRLQLSIE